MLKKLIKHEFIATYRIFVPIYIGLLIVTAVAFGFSLIHEQLDETVFTVLLGFGVITLFLVMMFVILSPYIFLAVRFYKTTATREAYLTFTLPAKTNSILLAKFLVSSFWVFVTVVLWYLSLMIMVYGFADENMFKALWDEVITQENFVTLLLYVVTLISGLAASVLTIFAAISLSQLVRDHRILASIAFYFVIYTIQQIISFVALIPYMIGTTALSVESESAMDSYTSMNASSELLGMYVLVIAICSGISLVCYFISKYMLSKKLNLL